MIKSRVRIYRSQRGKRGITKTQLARHIQVSPSYITKLEQGKIRPSAEVMFRMAEFFGCTVDDLFRHVPDKT